MMSRLRIVQVCADRGIAPGGTKGASMHLRGVAAGLQGLGHDVRTVSKRPPAAPGHPVPVVALTGLGQAIEAADMVYERYSLGHTEGLDLAQDHGVPFVLEVNAPLVDEARRHRPDTVGPGARQAEARLLRDSDTLVVVSRPLAEWAMEVRGSSRGVVHIPNGFEPAWFLEPDPTPVASLAFLGHPKPWHGATRLPDLLVRLAAFGLRPRLTIIGGGPGAADVMKEAGRLGVADQIDVTGPVAPQTAARLIRTCAISVAPYPPQEPFYFCPLKVIDSMAAGVPVVASALGDIPELVGDGGVVVPADSQTEFATAVAGLLQQPKRRAALAQRARQRADRRFSWSAIAQQILDASTTTVSS